MDRIQKKKPIAAGFNELIGRQIADIYGLLCPDIEVEIISDEECIISSLDLNITGSFVKPVYNKDLTSLYSIWEFLEDKYYDSKRLMYDFIKMYAMDMIFGNPDRSESNWGFLKIQNVPYLTVYDHEILFSKSHPSFITSDLDDIRFGLSTDDDMDFIITQKLQDIENFFATSSDEFVDLFIDIFNRIDFAKFKSILDIAEAEMNLLDEDRAEKEDYFNRTYDGIILLIKKYRPVRSK